MFRNVVVVGFVFFVSISSIFGQFVFGPKTALTLSFAKAETLLFDDPFDYLLYEVFFIDEDVSPSFGLFGRLMDDNLYLQTEVNYFTTSSNFKYINWEESTTPQFNETKTTHFLSLPVTAGIYIQNFKFGVGPIFSFILYENEIFKEFKYFKERRKYLESGFTFNAGVSFYRLDVDFRYEFHFNRVADYFVFQEFQSGFGQSPGYLSVILGYQF